MTMARYSGVVQDQAGNIITNAKIEVRRETPGAPLAALKDGPDGLVALTNPFNAESDGTFFFHVVGGFYKIRAYTGASSSPTFEQIIRYEGIGELQGYDLDAVLIGKRQQVRVATTANITIATALNNGDTLDGVTLATSDLVLVKNQTAKAENGVYVVGVSPARSAEFDTYNEHAGAMIAVVAGTQGGSVWFCTANAGGILDTTAIDFTELAATAGPPGADGEQGPPGPATIAIGTVTTVAAGEDATVTNSGTTEDVILDFEIPEGEQGPAGGVVSVVAGTNIAVDNTDPENPVVSATGIAAKAPLDSPGLTGVPTTPTAAPGTNTTQIASTGFVKAAIDAVLGGVASAFDTLSEIATDLAAKAPLASPGLTGVPTTPTAAPGTNTTQIASTGFVKAAIDAVLGGVASAFDTLSEIATDLGLKALKATTITAGAGLTGGGDLSTSRSLAIDPATQAEQEAASITTKAVTPGRQHFHPGMAKAWAVFNGSGTPAVIAGYNVASITDNGVGDWTIVFNDVMSNTNYCVLANAEEVSPADTMYPMNVFVRAGGKATGSVRVVALNLGAAKADYPAIFVAVFGDM